MKNKQINEFKGRHIGFDKKIAIVASRFNETITQNLVDGAIDCLLRQGVENKHIHLVWVPGAFEIPLAAQSLAISDQFDAVICLGAVIRGETPHFDYVSSQVAAGISQINLETTVPVIFGVLTTDTVTQAMERSGVKHGNKGVDSALAALEMSQILDQIELVFYDDEDSDEEGQEILRELEEELRS